MVKVHIHMYNMMKMVSLSLIEGKIRLGMCSVDNVRAFSYDSYHPILSMDKSFTHLGA